MAESGTFCLAETSKKYSASFGSQRHKLAVFVRNGKQNGEYCGKGQHQTGDWGRISHGNECVEPKQAIGRSS